MEALRTELSNKGLSKEEVNNILQLVMLQFSNACYEKGLSVEYAKKLLYSKEGLKMLTEKVKEYI
jgi:hypothetical protein